MRTCLSAGSGNDRWRCNEVAVACFPFAGVFATRNEGPLMTSFDLRSDAFAQAVIRIQRRAEKQELEERLSDSFVPTHVIRDLQTDQNQLVFGRRGVGKTHTLKVYIAKKVQEGFLCNYIDCTSFGSGIGGSASPREVGIVFFSKYVSTLADGLFGHVAMMEVPPTASQERLFDIVGELERAATPANSDEPFNYREIIRLVNLFAEVIGTPRIYLIIDEWAQIPLESQPYFAEFLKRSFFAAPRTTVKVGVVDYTYRLTDNVGGNIIGLEKSADIFSDVRMDRYFVWDQNAAFVEGFFAELLFNHLALGLNESVVCESTAKANAVRGTMFTQDKVFTELCRASEGNARDFLVIFGRAYADFMREAARERIGLPDVQRAAIEWYRQDKLASIETEPNLQGFLQYLIEDVIRDKKARAFMVPAGSIRHPLLRRLFAARILHPLDIEWAHPHRPGDRYCLVSIDYGTYASFKGIRNEPKEMLFLLESPDQGVSPEDLVPMGNDRRSIRRIVVTPDVLDKHWSPQTSRRLL